MAVRDHPGWHRTRELGAGLVAGWHYAMETDRSWGCGSSQKVVARGHGRASTVFGDLRVDNYPFEQFGNGRVAYVMASNEVYRVVGDRVAPLGVEKLGLSAEQEWPDLDGVDAAGAAILRVDGHLVRWSSEGGWRALFTAP